MGQTCVSACHWTSFFRISLFLFVFQHTQSWYPSATATRKQLSLSATKLYYGSNSTSDEVVSPLHRNALDPTASSGIGDIMGRQASELLRESGHSLAELYGIDNPLDRMLVTANGNLQRLFASYYDNEVSVTVLECTCQKSDLPALWVRKVELRLNQGGSAKPSLLCTARSEITIRSSFAANAIASETVGIGQWFRHSNVLPTFELHGAGYRKKDQLWRMYTLDSDDMQCRIREDFASNVWSLN